MGKKLGYAYRLVFCVLSIWYFTNVILDLHNNIYRDIHRISEYFKICQRL